MGHEGNIRASTCCKIIQHANSRSIVSCLFAHRTINIFVEETFVNNRRKMDFGARANVKEINNLLNKSWLSKFNKSIRKFDIVNAKII